MRISIETAIAIWQRILKIATIIIAGWVIQRFAIFSLKKLRRKVGKSKSETVAQTKQRVKTITSLLINTVKIIVNFTSVLLILSELGFNILPLITGVGIFGLAIGIGAKGLASDLIAGFFVLFENQFNVGDQIKVANSISGKVTKISLRTIALKDKDGNIHLVPNSSLKVITKITKNK